MEIRWMEIRCSNTNCVSNFEDSCSLNLDKIVVIDGFGLCQSFVRVKLISEDEEENKKDDF